MKPGQLYRGRQYLLLFKHTPKNDHGDPLCHRCMRNVATQQHERINRYQTPERSVARVLSYKATLCNYLCEDCHRQAEYPDVEMALWEASARIFGKEQVLKDLRTVQDAMLPLPVTIHLPEGWNG